MFLDMRCWNDIVRRAVVRLPPRAMSTGVNLSVPPLVARFRAGNSVDDALVDLPGRLDTFSRESVSEMLVAMGYFGEYSSESYETVVSYLNRTAVERRGPQPDLFDLKRFECMIRCGLIPNLSFDSFSKYNQRFLLTVRSRQLEVDQEPSELEDEVAELVKDISEQFYDSVVLGPYTLRFCKLGEPGITVRKAEKDPDLRTLVRRFVCVEVLDSDSFVSGREMSPHATIRQAILARLGVICVQVPYFDWLKLPDAQAKRLYLHSVISSPDSPPS